MQGVEGEERGRRRGGKIGEGGKGKGEKEVEGTPVCIFEFSLK